MSHRDYAWFLQRRGEHEAARRQFEAMAADIDSLIPNNDYPYYAGEYYEAIGDLMQTDIHALAVTAVTEAEARAAR